MNSSHRVPGSDKAMTLTQIRDAFNVPDWHPEGHPPMPEGKPLGPSRRSQDAHPAILSASFSTSSTAIATDSGRT